MRQLSCAIVLGVLISSVGAGPAADVSKSAEGSRPCDTTFVGRSGAPWQNQANWSDGIPRAGDVACLPGEADRTPHATFVSTGSRAATSEGTRTTAPRLGYTMVVIT